MYTPVLLLKSRDERFSSICFFEFLRSLIWMRAYFGTSIVEVIRVDGFHIGVGRSRKLQAAQ